MKYNRSEVRLAFAFIAPAAAVMAFITVYPLLYGIWMAFTNYNPTHIRGRMPRFVGFQNFIDIFQHAPYLDFDFARVLGFNFLWTFSNMFFHVTVGVGLALLLNQPWLKGVKIYRALLILPWAVPSYVTSLVWRNMFDPEAGAINLLLKQFAAAWGGWQQQIAWLPGLGEGWTGLDWLGTMPSAFFAVLTVNIWLGFPFMMMVASGALQAIPSDLYEAADLDGANPFQRFLTVTVPMLRPSMIPAILLGFIWTFNNFNVIYFVTKGDPLGQTQILITQAYKLVDGGLYGVGAAFAVVIFFILFGISTINSRLTRVVEENA